MVNRYVRSSLACSLAVLTAISSQIKLYIGPIPFTFQNFAVVLSGLLLGRYGAVAQLIYLGMIALGFPISARGGGTGILLGYTAGYLWMFPVAAFIMGVIREYVWRNGGIKDMILLWLGSAVAVIPIYVLGFAVFYYFVRGDVSLLQMYREKVMKFFGLDTNSFWSVFFMSVLVFVPQDLFMDHVIALIVFKYIYDVLRERGCDLP